MTPNKRKLWGISLPLLITLAAIGLAFIIFISMEIFRTVNPYLDREVSGPLTITSEWKEIVPEAPLRAERQAQYLSIETTKSFDPDYKLWGIRLPDGSVFVPEVQLIDQDGNIHNLKSSSFELADRNRTDIISGIGFSAKDLPKDRHYKMVRIRSEKPLSISRITWRCYNQWDIK